MDPNSNPTFRKQQLRQSTLAPGLKKLGFRADVLHYEVHMHACDQREKLLGGLRWGRFDPVSGYCGITDFEPHRRGAELRCSTGRNSGGWAAKANGINSLMDCAAHCRKCARCRFASYSRTTDDCSWYASCGEGGGVRGPPDLGPVNYDPRDYRSVEVYRPREGICGNELAAPGYNLTYYQRTNG